MKKNCCSQPRLEELLEKRYGQKECLTQDEVAEIYGVTKMCVCKWEQKIMAKLKRELEKRGIKSFADVGLKLGGDIN